MLLSSTQHIPDTSDLPQHIAIIMDGNGRWATERHLPRVAGHKKGLDAVRATIEQCGQLGIRYLTLFAFSSENWRRPADEVSVLMGLFVMALEREVSKLHKNDIQLRVVGDLSAFDQKLQKLILDAQNKTANNTRLVLTIAANYGGRWDILQATKRMLSRQAQTQHQIDQLTEADLTPFLSMSYAPEPDLFIRTGGEQRISNFLIWQLAYTELYFTPCYWPDFSKSELEKALAFYKTRERRFGRTSEQLLKKTT